jgi:hypothetical protein
LFYLNRKGLGQRGGAKGGPWRDWQVAVGGQQDSMLTTNTAKDILGTGQGS